MLLAVLWPATGLVTPIVNGLVNPGGMAFIPATQNPAVGQETGAYP